MPYCAESAIKPQPISQFIARHGLGRTLKPFRKWS